MSFRRRQEFIPRARFRRGVVYAIIMAISLLLGVMAITGLVGRRIEARRYSLQRYSTDARLMARSALELGLGWIMNNSSWRASIATGSWSRDIALGSGTIRAEISDPTDGNLTDSNGDPVVIRGIGMRDTSRQIMEVRISPQINALDVLKANIYAAGQVKVGTLKTLTLSGGPLWTPASLDNNGVVTGNVECSSVIGLPVVGLVTSPTTHQLPSITDAWAYYAARATTIAYTGDWDKVAIGPGVNPFGTPNADGIYLINTGNNDFRIRRSRVLGTLLVNCGTKTLDFDKPVLFQPNTSGAPSLIVNGNVDFSMDASTLRESDSGVNFNPPGMPYSGVADADTSDNYPTEFQGIIHVSKTITVSQAVTVRGTLLADDKITVNNTLSTIHDTATETYPPEPYRWYTYVVQDGTWRRVVE